MKKSHFIPIGLLLIILGSLCSCESLRPSDTSETIVPASQKTSNIRFPSGPRVRKVYTPGRIDWGKKVITVEEGNTCNPDFFSLCVWPSSVVYELEEGPKADPCEVWPAFCDLERRQPRLPFPLPEQISYVSREAQVLSKEVILPEVLTGEFSELFPKVDLVYRVDDYLYIQLNSRETAIDQEILANDVYTLEASALLTDELVEGLELSGNTIPEGMTLPTLKVAEEDAHLMFLPVELLEWGE
ncbi:MAG: hypothetical protein ACFB0B_13470 [Thermonemataceae bacterium]